jgi:DNA-binding transcriptional MerR regulator
MQKQTYTISELASEFEVTTRTIRFYEEKGLVQPVREAHTRLYTAADRVRIKLILRGKRIGMTLKESVEVIDLYDPKRNNAEQLLSLINTISVRRARLLQQKDDIDDMLTGLNEVLRLCEKALGKRQNKVSSTQKNC